MKKNLINFSSLTGIQNIMENSELAIASADVFIQVQNILISLDKIQQTNYKVEHCNLYCLKILECFNLIND